MSNGHLFVGYDACILVNWLAVVGEFSGGSSRSWMRADRASAERGSRVTLVGALSVTSRLAP